VVSSCSFVIVQLAASASCSPELLSAPSALKVDEQSSPRKGQSPKARNDSRCISHQPSSSLSGHLQPPAAITEHRPFAACGKPSRTNTASLFRSCHSARSFRPSSDRMSNQGYYGGGGCTSSILLCSLLPPLTCAPRSHRSPAATKRLRPARQGAAAILRPASRPAAVGTTPGSIPSSGA
jgi:hypothetical protein